MTDTDVGAIVREQLVDQNAATLHRTVGIMFGNAATVEENSFIPPQSRTRGRKWMR